MNGSMPDQDVCVVVPAYHEAAVLGSVLDALQPRFGHVVVVDDGSADATSDIARSRGATVVRHSVNLGQGAALQTGITWAVTRTPARWVVTFDADGQHDAEDAAAMVVRARSEDVQVVLGSRFLGTTDAPSGRRALLRAAARFTNLTTGLGVTDAHNGLRVLRRDAARDLRLRLHGMAHASELLEEVARHGWTHVEHPVHVHYSDYSSAKGQPSYNALNIAFELAWHRLRSVS